MTKNSLLILASQQCKLACPGAASIIFQMQYSDIGGVATCSRPLISDIRYAHAGSQTWNSAGDAVDCVALYTFGPSQCCCSEAKINKEFLVIT